MEVASLDVTDADLAALAGVTPRRIRQLATEGKLARVGRNRFQLGPAVQVLLAEAAENNEGSELQRERLLKLRAERVMAELELAKQTGEVALISEFERVQTARAALIRANVLNVVQRSMLRLLGESDEAKFRTVLSEELIGALKSAADATVTLREDAGDNEGLPEEIC